MNVLTSRCLVYFYSRRSRQETLRALSQRTGCRVESERHVYTLSLEHGYFGLHINETAAAAGEPIEPGDYRSFPYALDLMREDPRYAHHGIPIRRHDELDASLAPLVTEVLNYFWSHQEAAIAECSFEEALPFSGGREKSDQPWPTEGVEAA